MARTQRAVADAEAELVADAAACVAEVDDEVVAAHPEHRDAGRGREAVGVDVLAAEGHDRLVAEPARPATPAARRRRPGPDRPRAGRA